MKSEKPPILKVDLKGVPETLLWPLHHRAAAARKRTFFRDESAIAIADAIEYPYERNFGRLDSTLVHRAMVFDQEVMRFMRAHPGCTVVELAAGLETQFERVDDGKVRWLAVDLPESIAVRERFLPTEGRHRNVACSALDFRWMEEVDTEHGVFVTAAGLLMYLKPSDVRHLVVACAERFPGGSMVFDAIPRWLSRRTQKGLRRTLHYRLPAMPWGLDANEQNKVLAWSDRIANVTDLLPHPYDATGLLLRLMAHIPLVRQKRHTMMRLDFSGE